MPAQGPRRWRTGHLFRLSGVWALGAAALAGCAPPGAARAEGSAQATRTLAWTGGDRLWLSVPADARYVRGPQASVVITGPKRLIDHIVVDHGAIRYQGMDWGWPGGWPWRDGRVRIVVTAPYLSAVALSGSGQLDLGRLSQDQLDLTLSGSGRATASGSVRRLQVKVFGSGGARLDGLTADEVKAGLAGSGWLSLAGACESLRLWISGSGHADLGALKADQAEAVLSGSGSARLSPRTWANLTLTGSGSVRLLSEPARLEVHRFGSARVIHPREL
jgi:hypothetical protein